MTTMTEQELRQVAFRVHREGEDFLFDEPQLFERLLSHFSKEIPYGIATAKTGDPYIWIGTRLLLEYSPAEFRRLVPTN